MERIEEAVILAAGEGQRLRPFTGAKPKVMLPIANKPILQYVVEAAAQNGVRRIVMVVGYRKEQVQNYFGSGEGFEVEIDYVFQPQQVGTAHALKQAAGRVGERFLVLSGDNYIESATIADLVRGQPNAILVREQENIPKYGVVVIAEGVVTDIVEKPTEAPSHLVNTGIYLFTRQVCDFIEQEADLPSALRQMIASGCKMRTYQTTGTWFDVVYPWDLLKLNDLVLGQTRPSLGGTLEKGVSLRGAVCIGPGTVIRANSYLVGPLVIGEGCEVGPSVTILPSTTIGNSVHLAPYTLVENSVIGDDVQIGPSSTLRDSIVDRGCRLGAHFVARSGEARVWVDDECHRVQMGAMLGEYCALEEGVIVNPGVMVGNHSRIRALKVIEESIPDQSLVV